ncbi:alpha/beta hydrolase [Agromyces mediolanus]|uniref:Lysophospholipase n=1 Tax=Agromyces mediolanus TaxID=41986 RepID=A0A918CMJ5_AGRME|nr:alpha/beta hydrolase [Agromyces mediolanus]GGR28806.1 lysophospholipase [Agromyces mediolanus]GLJ72129.1 lysophospholipase [Agromyces mediolanus]
MTAAWRPDVLGPGFEQLTLPLGSDDEGELVATLVRYTPPAASGWWPFARTPRGPVAGCDVLSVHGWSDYFFNPELARFWAAQGARFFALDLRKYGRSLRPGQTPGLITDLADYDVDLDAALTAMRAGGPARPLILMGHSTGGLTLSLWADRHRGRARALVLNSPWLEFQLSRVGREALAPVFALGARVHPLAPLPNVDLGFYTRAVAKEQGGEWEYDHRWRPDRGFATSPVWLNAILAGHARVAAGIDVGSPALTLLSARSSILTRWDESMRTSDSVLVVDEIAERALKLGPEVTVSRIDGALHDVTLSREPARAAAYASISRWLRGYAPR